MIHTGHLKIKDIKDVRIHFVGETIMAPSECAEVKRALQFIGFLIFRMLSEQDKSVGTFSASMKQKCGRRIARLCKNNESVFVLLENVSGEWIARLDGTKEEISEFVMEYMVHSLTQSKL